MLDRKVICFTSLYTPLHLFLLFLNLFSSLCTGGLRYITHCYCFVHKYIDWTSVLSHICTLFSAIIFIRLRSVASISSFKRYLCLVLFTHFLRGGVSKLAWVHVHVFIWMKLLLRFFKNVVMLVSDPKKCATFGWSDTRPTVFLKSSSSICCWSNLIPFLNKSNVLFTKFTKSLATQNQTIFFFFVFLFHLEFSCEW